MVVIEHQPERSLSRSMISLKSKLYINRETTKVQILWLQINLSYRTKEKSRKMKGMIYGQKMEV